MEDERRLAGDQVLVEVELPVRDGDRRVDAKDAGRDFVEIGASGRVGNHRPIIESKASDFSRQTASRRSVNNGFPLEPAPALPWVWLIEKPPKGGFFFCRN